MVSRNRGGFSTEEEALSSSSSSSSSSSISEMLIFTTMCIIGHDVDVYVKDGSIYSGIFYTSSLQNEYAIVLKKAKLTKKGNLVANVANMDVIETLIIKSQDLVQVVSKGVRDSANGCAGNASTGDIGATNNAASTGCVEKSSQVTNNRKHHGNKKRISWSRSSTKGGNGLVDTSTHMITEQLHDVVDAESQKTISTDMSKKEEASTVESDTRYTGRDGLLQQQGDSEEKSDNQKTHKSLEVQSSISTPDAYETQSNLVPDIPNKIISKMLPNNVHDNSIHSDVKLYSPEVVPSSETISSDLSATILTTRKATSELRLSSSTPTKMAPAKISSLNKNAKEFKLNAGAKTFSPSFAHQISVTPPVGPAATSVPYITENSPVVSISTAQPDVEVSSFAPRSLPVKYVPYGGVVSGNGGTELQYPQPVVGHLVNRTQPVRYTGHYHPVQAGATYVHPTSQNVMVGRLGPLVYVHPVSHDVAQGAPAFSQVSSVPLYTPHQVHLTKHQGTTPAQALQWCSTPPYIAAGQQPFTVPSHVPVSAPHFPVIRPIPVPGSNGFLGSKFS